MAGRVIYKELVGITWPEELPVTFNWGHKAIGTAMLSEKNGEVTAVINLTEAPASLLQLMPAGKITSREGNKITGFNMTSVSISRESFNIIN